MKRLKKIGLNAAYQNEEDTQVVSCSLMALKLLPVVDIVPGFEDVKALVKPESASQAQLLMLCRYAERQWITKASIGFLCTTIRRVQITPRRVFSLVCVDVYRWSIQTCSPFLAICNALLSTLMRR